MILDWLRRLAGRRSPARDVPVGPGTVLGPSFRLDDRGGVDAMRVGVGAESRVECTIVLERSQGEVRIGDRTHVGGGTTLVCATGITIGSDVLIAWGVTVVDHDSHSTRWEERSRDVERWRLGMQRGGAALAASTKAWDTVPMAPIVIRDRAWIGFNAIILKGVTIGEGAVVAAGSVVTRDVPAYSVAAGNPARVVRTLPDAGA